MAISTTTDTRVTIVTAIVKTVTMIIMAIKVTTMSASKKPQWPL